MITYTLEHQELTVNYQVENTGKEEMYFGIGGHPAFNVPLESSLTFEDYYLSFSPKKSRTQIPLAGPFIDLANKTLAQTNTSFDLTHQLFENDAMIFETKGQTAITIFCSIFNSLNVFTMTDKDKSSQSNRNHG